MRKILPSALASVVALAGASFLPPPSARAADATLNGDVLNVTENTAYDTLYLGSGYSRVVVADGVTLTVGQVVRQAGAALDVRVPATATFTVTDTAGLGLVGGGGAYNTNTASIVPWMVGSTNTSSFFVATDFVTYDATEGVVTPITYYTSSLNSVGSNAAYNVATGSVTMFTFGKTVNSLRYTGGGVGSLGNFTLNITSGALALTANNGGLNNGTINFGTREGVIYSFGTNTNTISSALTGSNGITKAGTGTLVLSGANTHTGTVNVASGTLRAGAANVLNSTPVALANSAATSLDLNGFNQRVASLAGGGAQGGNVSLGTATLTVGHNGAASATTYAGVIGGTGNVVKTDASTQILSGANTYEGGTLIDGGDLRLANATGSATGSGAVSVSGATVSGTGIATGLTTVQNGGYVAAGLNNTDAGTGRAHFGSVGTLGLGTVGGLVLTDAMFDFDLANVATAGAGINDLIATAALTFDTATLGFTFNGLDGALQTGVAYTLIDASVVAGFDTANISTTFLGALDGLYTASYSIGGDNDLLVTFAASGIPEPSTYALVLGGAGLLAGLFRRRRSTVR